MADEAIREPMGQTRIAAVAAGTGSQPKFEKQDRASQITARLIRNGQRRHAMRVEFPARFFNRLAPTTTDKQGSNHIQAAQPKPESRIARAACAADSCNVQHEDASIGFITSLQRLIFFLLYGLGNDSFIALYYSLVFGGCQVHRRRCYTGIR